MKKVMKFQIYEVKEELIRYLEKETKKNTPSDYEFALIKKVNNILEKGDLTKEDLVKAIRNECLGGWKKGMEIERKWEIEPKLKEIFLEILMVFRNRFKKLRNGKLKKFEECLFNYESGIFSYNSKLREKRIKKIKKMLGFINKSRYIKNKKKVFYKSILKRYLSLILREDCIIRHSANSSQIKTRYKDR